MSLEEFPSPTGVLYLLIRCNENYRLDAQGVSVPYWGSLSSNLIQIYVKPLRIMVSVPYWGSLSSNAKWYKIMRFEVKGFRPLLGFSIF